MKIISLLLFALINNIILMNINALKFNNPCLTITNNRNEETVLVEYDPNWDDQVLLINNKEETDHFRQNLHPKESVEICSLYPKSSPGGSFGIIIAKKFQITVRNINLETQKAIEKVVIDDYEDKLKLSDVTFLKANLSISNELFIGNALKFLK